MMTPRILLIGPVASGKTTLKQALLAYHASLKPPVEKSQFTQLAIVKTQALEFDPIFIDSPGEFFEWPGLHGALTTTAAEVNVIVVVADAVPTHVRYPHGIAAVLPTEVIGVVTKIDDPAADVTATVHDLARFLECQESEIVQTSAMRGDGIKELAMRLGLINRITNLV